MQLHAELLKFPLTTGQVGIGSEQVVMREIQALVIIIRVLHNRALQLQLIKINTVEVQ